MIERASNAQALRKRCNKTSLPPGQPYMHAAEKYERFASDTQADISTLPILIAPQWMLTLCLLLHSP